MNLLKPLFGGLGQLKLLCMKEIKSRRKKTISIQHIIYQKSEDTIDQNSDTTEQRIYKKRPIIFAFITGFIGVGLTLMSQYIGDKWIKSSEISEFNSKDTTVLIIPIDSTKLQTTYSLNPPNKVLKHFIQDSLRFKYSIEDSDFQFKITYSGNIYNYKNDWYTYSGGYVVLEINGFRYPFKDLEIHPIRRGNYKRYEVQDTINKQISNHITRNKHEFYDALKRNLK